MSWLVRFGVYLVLGLRVKLWSYTTYFDLAQVIFLISCYFISSFPFGFLLLLFFDCVYFYLVLFSFYLDFLLPLFCSSSSFLDLSFLFLL